MAATRPAVQVSASILNVAIAGVSARVRVENGLSTHHSINFTSQCCKVALLTLH